MIRQHLRQAWTMMKQHRLFTGIYIAGTTLSVTMIIITFGVLYIKFGPIYPEGNRDRMLTIKRISTTQKVAGGMDIKKESGCSSKLAEMIKEDSRYLDHISCTDRGDRKVYLSATPDKKSKRLKEWAIYADEGFWNVYTYKFINGHPFNAEDVKTNNRVAVISQNTAMELFETTEVSGRHIYVNGEELTIVGVVKDASPITEESYSALIMPLGLSKAEPWQHSKELDLTWRYYIRATAKDATQRDELKKEIEEKLARYNAADTTRIYSLDERILNHVESQFDSYDKEAYKDFVKEIALMVAAFLLIPAMCLSIMIHSRMEQRMVEFGVRKAYGATGGSIVSQVLCENMLLTLVGGFIGLAISIAILYNAGEIVLFMYDSNETLSDKLYDIENFGAPQIDFSMIFSPSLFAAILIVCLAINVTSALLPVLIKMRHSIVYSLNRRK